MRKTIPAILATAFLMSAPAVGIADEAEPTRGEALLAKILDGRVAGEPTNCIARFPTARMSIIDGTAIVVRQAGKIYVNVPVDPDRLDDSDVLITRSFGSRLCNTDIIQTASRGSGFVNGGIFLNEFVPYSRIGS